MDQIDKEFHDLQEKIKRDLGEETQKELLENSLDSFFKKIGKPTQGSEYDAMRSKLGLVGRKKDASDDEKCIKILYDSALVRILTVAEKIEKYDGKVDQLLSQSQKFVPPEDKQWGFKLGDKVMIQGSLEDFKSLQKATVGWTGRLRRLIGEIGYVKGVMSEYDNLVGVRFPRIGTETHLYAGVLKKIEEEDDRPRKWKVGEYVKTYGNQRLLTIVQGELTPAGKIGRVVGFTSDLLLVTFDEQTVHEVSPAALISGSVAPNASEQETSLQNYTIGQKVSVIKNMKKLIDNQKQAMSTGGWNAMMSKLRGKVVTILNINNDGGLNVQAASDRQWRISSNSVLRQGETEPHADDLEFTIGDVIRVKIPTNIRSLLESCDIPLSFIEYLRLTGEVRAVGSEHQPYISFCNWPRQTESSDSFLRKPSPDKVQKYLDIKGKIDAVSVGDIVHLDVGPPNFVTEVLETFKRDKEVVMALTKQATVKGFIDNDTVVIEYDDGSLYMMKKKYLSVPERFYIEGFEKNVDLEFGKRILQAFEAATRSITGEEQLLHTIQFSSGNPPSIEITTHRYLPHDKVTEWMQKMQDWKIEMLCEGQLLIRSDNFGKVKLSMSFGEKTERTSSSSRVVVGKDDEKPSALVEARPTFTPPTDEELRRLPTSFLRFYDEALGQDVYFPYLVHGQRRVPAPVRHTVPEDRNATTYYTYNFTDSNVGRVNISN